MAVEERIEGRFAALKRLVEPGETDLGAAFTRLSSLIGSSGEDAQVEFEVVEGRRTHRWHLDVRPKEASAGSGPARRADVRVIVPRSTWQRIAEGELSPLEAFLAGELRVRGDVDLGKRLFRRVAARGGELDICC